MVLKWPCNFSSTAIITGEGIAFNQILTL